MVCEVPIGFEATLLEIGFSSLGRLQSIFESLVLKLESKHVIDASFEK